VDPTIKLAPLQLSALLEQYNIKPSKGLGQNFLVEDGVLRKVVQAADITPEDEVLEIGPGLGSLTRYLAYIAHRVVAVELDRKMIAPLAHVLSPYDNVEIIQGDILEQDLATLFTKSGYLVVANIPYYITSAVIRHLLETEYKPQRVVLTIQKEVAQRVCAQETRNLLALSVQVYGTPTIAARVPAGAFFPRPNVDSAVLRVDLYPEPLIPSHELDLFFRLAKAGFAQKRKTLRNALSAGMQMPKADVETRLTAVDIDAGRRAETLDLEEWKRLTLGWRLV
jgi:16S rRNA (adenine1518-N6/adenine1519-N6)-dimethyltransferase